MHCSTSKTVMPTRKHPVEARQGGAGTREPSTWEAEVGGVMGLRLTMVHMHWGVQLQLRYQVKDPFSKKMKQEPQQQQNSGVGWLWLSPLDPAIGL